MYFSFRDTSRGLKHTGGPSSVADWGQNAYITHLGADNSARTYVVDGVCGCEVFSTIMIKNSRI
jgi:hypothetical protein